MKTINDVKNNNIPKVNYDDKKYDVFFSYMVPDINPKYLDKEGKFELSSEKWEEAQGGKAPFKSFSVQIADSGEKCNNRELYTKHWPEHFGYEFDINDRNFNVIFGSFRDAGSGNKSYGIINNVQNNFQPGERYRKINLQSEGVAGNSYVWNKKMFNDGTDVRDIVVPKMVSRLETFKEVLADGEEKKDEAEFMKYAYKLHQEQSNFDASFTEENYGHEMYKTDLKLSETKDGKKVYFAIYNEVGVAPRNEGKSRVRPKRLIFEESMLQPRLGIPNSKIDDAIYEFCNANGTKYKTDVRILSMREKRTRVISPKQFRDMVIGSEYLSKLLSDKTKQRLEKMVEECENINNVKKDESAKFTEKLPLIKNTGIFLQNNVIKNSGGLPPIRKKEVYLSERKKLKMFDDNKKEDDSGKDNNMRVQSNINVYEREIRDMQIGNVINSQNSNQEETCCCCCNIF